MLRKLFHVPSSKSRQRGVPTRILHTLPDLNAATEHSSNNMAAVTAFSLINRVGDKGHLSEEIPDRCMAAADAMLRSAPVAEIENVVTSQKALDSLILNCSKEVPILCERGVHEGCPSYHAVTMLLCAID